ncbi:class I SAM-dependent methyltransferase [Streptantibioticus silvisoli]|uniref:Class I SAM-dependent methyltransferase n=1 Tax=Streptantibioticus silvisoli TaxID=2705255 RepID=A0ABT6VU20_9ACTN|nr:class I SAM-dependent methyltransferase [Streptantibioticus silvisoli]MDI5961978.1 class I SAM-dependent methyltransferase [Streptantibioticus silvisoli]
MTDEHRKPVPVGQMFGAVAEVFDAARPGYAVALVPEVLAYADLRGRPMAEVGAGTGKATVPFAAALARRRTPLVAVEPDARMAEVLRRNTAAYPHVSVEVRGFECWRPEGRRYGLVLAATCWHWFDRDRRWDLVHAALAPGGAVALVWNPQGVRDPRLHARLAEVDARHGVAGSPHADLASVYADTARSWGPGSGWPEGECRSDARFTDLRSVRFHRDRRYDTVRYLDFLATVSAYRALPAARRARALADVARVLDGHGGGIDMDHITDLFLARVAR